MFQILEQHEEMRLCEEGEGKFKREVRYYRDHIMRFIIYNVSDTENIYTNSYQSKNYSTIRPDSYHSYSQENNETDQYYAVTMYLNEFKEKIISIRSDTGFEGQNCKLETKWKFSSALLYIYKLLILII